MLKFSLTALHRWVLLLFGLLFTNPAFPALVINEFLASNDSTLADEDGDYSDWLEIHNPGATAISLEGYHLTDEATNLDKWTFPAVTIEPGEFLVVFASGKDRVDPAGNLHTDFSLSAAGEYLALVAPDGLTVLSSFAPAFPPQFEDESFGLDRTTGEWTFFSNPTPGSTNPTGTRAGPIIELLEKDPPQPVTGPLTIAVRVREANDPVVSVSLHYRKMYGPETVAAMEDDGTGADAFAEDGIWTAVIPQSAFAPGEMTRWRFTARDSEGTETREPAFRAPLDSHQYYGTVGHDPSLETLLPVVHWFTSNPNGATTAGGSRGSVYYAGEFYDNVLFNLHGQSTASFPKKSYNIDFNRTQRFQWSTNAPRVADIDLLTNWADKSKVRHVLAYEVMRASGVAAHFAFTVRVQQNGAFYSTADFVEDADEIYLERAGLNPDGALYKVYSNLLNKDNGDTAFAGVEKKNRKTENNSDLQALIDGLDLTGTALNRYLFDNVNIPACVNMLAANSVIRNMDMGRKNWYIYRDTGRSDEWAILPWDLDLSHGRVWNQQNTYFDNALYTDGFVVTGTSIRLVSHLFANPNIRPMIMRRIRTLADRFLQPPPAPGTPESELFYERRLNEQLALLDPASIVPSDARRDFEKWGSWLQTGTRVPYTSTDPAVETMVEAIQRWKTEYLPGRRHYIYNTQIVGKGGEIPLPQSSAAAYDYVPLITAGAQVKALVPANGALGNTWMGSAANEPFDDSGWMNGTTGVGYEGGSGYEDLIGLDVGSPMEENTSVFIRIEFDVADPSAFERLELRMKYDDGFAAFLNGAVLTAANAPASMQWDSGASALHEANPADFDVFDVTSRLSSLRAGRNILAIQGLNDSLSSSDMLIVPELYGATLAPPSTEQPRINFGAIEFSPASGNQDEEFIELTNPNPIAVDISDWRITGGIEHTFPGGTVLPAGGTLYLSPDAAAFRARSVSPRGGEGRFVQGGYLGHLSSLGETLILLDSSGATNNTATYEGQPSDVQLYLVVSEVMYHPPGDGLAEFIELLNISDSVTLDLTGVRFTVGVEFDFTTGAITSLAPGERLLVVRDLAAFEAVHGPGLPVAGTFTNLTALGNAGEEIKLEDPENGTIREFAYLDEAPWPAQADGPGYSLVLIAPESNPDHNIATNWTVSARLGGSPGQPEPEGHPLPEDPAGDANGNGEPDLIDYVLGNDLGLPSIAPVFNWQINDLGEPGLFLTHPSNPEATQATLEILFSTDLLNWQDGADALELISTEDIGDGRALRTLEIKPPLRDEPRLFMQLRATVQ